MLNFSTAEKFMNILQQICRNLDQFVCFEMIDDVFGMCRNINTTNKPEHNESHLKLLYL